MRHKLSNECLIFHRKNDFHNLFLLSKKEISTFLCHLLASLTLMNMGYSRFYRDHQVTYTRVCVYVIINLDRTSLACYIDAQQDEQQERAIRVSVRACDFKRVRVPCHKRGCWMRRMRSAPESCKSQLLPALRKAAAGRWSADVYNLALIAGPGEE